MFAADNFYGLYSCCGLSTKPVCQLFCKHPVNGAVMVANANARTFFSLLLIYAVSNIYFQTKTSETFIWYEQRLFGMNNSPAAPRIAIRKRNLEYFAVVLHQCGKSKLQLTSTSYHKLPVAAIRWGKRGDTMLAVPGHLKLRSLMTLHLILDRLQELKIVFDLDIKS